MTKHTPGPWERFTAAGGQPAIKQAGPKGKYLFDVSEYAGLGNEAEANARLIAAAPDMLKALQAIVHGRDSQGLLIGSGDMQEIAEAAIRKATGDA